jgi:glycine dehydrogenase subunit 1
MRAPSGSAQFEVWFWIRPHKNVRLLALRAGAGGDPVRGALAIYLAPESRRAREPGVPRWISSEPGEEAALLAALGLRDADELFRDIPRDVRSGSLRIGRALEEPELVARVDRLLERNRPYGRFSSFLGGRVAVRHVPAAVDSILGRSEFYTSYTPYQPEASQGMLQALFEFQSLWVELTGMDVANASLYDGATAAGEALLLAHRIRDGRRFLVPASLPWEERSVLENYARGIRARVESIGYDPVTGGLDVAALEAAVSSGDVFGLLADVPNGFGGVDDALLDLKSRLGEVPLVAVADPLALCVLAPPGDWGADIVVAEGQGFGSPAAFGGPLLGLIACRREYVRLAPGRIVGATKDSRDARAFALTLQTREQHIRRSRATSNICTNESLAALAFVSYASLVGPKGLARLAERLHERARDLARALGALRGLKAPRFSAPFFDGFAVELEASDLGTAEFLERLRRRRVLGGIPLADPRPGRESDGNARRFLASATEFTTERDIARYARAAASGLRGTAEGVAA